MKGLSPEKKNQETITRVVLIPKKSANNNSLKYDGQF
jgi:hypothetical protein